MRKIEIYHMLPSTSTLYKCTTTILSMHSKLDLISADSEVSLPGVHFEDCKSYKNKVEFFFISTVL